MCRLRVGADVKTTGLAPLDPLRAWREQCSNWGRWGVDDRRGTVNLIDSTKTRSAAALVREGLSFSCSRRIPRATEDEGDTATVHVMVRTKSSSASSDFLGLAPHGYGVTHIDALSHWSVGGEQYNGAPAQRTGIAPASEVGIDQLSGGVFTRGVLIDLPLSMGVPYVDPRTQIEIAHLERALSEQSVVVEAGDALLVRTGRWAVPSDESGSRNHPKMAGLHPSCIPWIHEHDIAVLGCDGVTDPLPAVYSEKSLPIHEIALTYMGMPLLDNMELDRLAEHAADVGRWEFLFVFAPLVIKAGTGSPVNPLAVF